VSEFNAESLLDELRAITGKSPAGHSSEELAAAWDVSQKTALIRIKMLAAAGRMVFVGHRKGVGVSGKAMQTPVYRVIGKPKCNTSRSSSSAR
jgi:biotin operon repressor